MDFLLSEVEFRALFSAFDCGSSQRVSRQDVFLA